MEKDKKEEEKYHFCWNPDGLCEEDNCFCDKKITLPESNLFDD